MTTISTTHLQAYQAEGMSHRHRAGLSRRKTAQFTGLWPDLVK